MYDLNTFPVHQPLTAQHCQLLPYGDVRGLVPDVDEIHGLDLKRMLFWNTVMTSEHKWLLPIQFHSQIQTYHTFASAPFNISMLIPIKNWRSDVEALMMAVQCWDWLMTSCIYLKRHPEYTDVYSLNHCFDWLWYLKFICFWGLPQDKGNEYSVL